MTHEEMCEAWAYTINNCGRTIIDAWISRKYGGVRISEKFFPLKRRKYWSEQVNIWRDEMEDRYGEDGDENQD